MSFKLDLTEDKKVIERLKSYQFKLSQKIFGQRIHLNLSRDEAAKLTGLSPKQYTQFEQGVDLNSSEATYQQVLNKLTTLKQNQDIKIDNTIVTNSTSKVKSGLSEFPIIYYLNGVRV